jgi:hypothetical protein
LKKTTLIIFYFLSCSLFGQTIRFQLLPLSFASGKTEISETDYPIFDSLASFLRKTGARIEIGGHTDNLGTPAQNEELSRLRAQAICDYLKTARKIPSDQLVIKGYGPSRPIASNRTPSGRARNNRIEITVLNDIPRALMTKVRGAVRIRKTGLTDWCEVKQDQPVSVADRVETDSNGYCVLVLENGGKIRMRNESELVFEELTAKAGYEPAAVKLWSEGGKFQIENYPVPENPLRLAIGSAVLQLTCDAANFLYEAQPLAQDLISVWRGKVTVQDRIESPAVEVGEGYGIRCRIGKPCEAPSVLPTAPVFQSVSGKDTLFIEPGKPLEFVLRYKRSGDYAGRIVLSRDRERDEMIADIVSLDDSLYYAATGVDVVYATLASVENGGLEGPRTPARLVGLIRKTTGSKLVITRQSTEIRGDKRVLLLEGRTEPLSVLSVNEERIKIPDDGIFSMMIRLGPGTNRVTLKSVNRWGQASTLSINLKAGFKYDATLFCGPSYLAGRGSSNSSIGLIYGANFSIKLSEKLVFGPLAAMGEIRCRAGSEPDAEHYRTSLILGGLRLKYLLNPKAGVVLHAGLEAGIFYWKSIYDSVVQDWSINPLGGLTVGARVNLSERISLVPEAGAAYFRNKDKYNLGSQSIKYILPTGRLGLVFGF